MYILIYTFRDTRRTSKPICASDFIEARENGKLTIPKRAELLAVRRLKNA